jgi:hypothetical protein
MLKPYTLHQNTQKLSPEPQPSQREAGTYQKQNSTQFTQEHHHYNPASCRGWL